MEGFTCPRCGEFHAEVPMCFGAAFPDYYFSVPPEERDSRVELTESLCIIDDAHFFIRGRIEIPVLDSEEVFCWDVWTTLSEANFWRTNEVWNAPDRVNEPACFGWLQTSIPGYPETLNLRTMVHTQPVGVIPRIEVVEEGHLLKHEQQHGIAQQRVTELVGIALHGLPDNNQPPA